MNSATKTVRGVAVEKRTIYAFGKRKSSVYDARLDNADGRFCATEATAKEAVDAVLADVTYVATQRRESAHGCRLYPQGAGEWCFVLPSGGSMCFDAADFAAAFARVRSDYADHEGCAAFFASVRYRPRYSNHMNSATKNKASTDWRSAFAAALAKQATKSGCDISRLTWEDCTTDRTWGDKCGLVFFGASPEVNERAPLRPQIRTRQLRWV